MEIGGQAFKAQRQPSVARTLVFEGAMPCVDDQSSASRRSVAHNEPGAAMEPVNVEARPPSKSVLGSELRSGGASAYAARSTDQMGDVLAGKNPPLVPPLPLIIC